MLVLYWLCTDLCRADTELFAQTINDTLVLRRRPPHEQQLLAELTHTSFGFLSHTSDITIASYHTNTWVFRDTCLKCTVPLIDLQKMSAS